jgi:hypothetical protein
MQSDDEVVVVAIRDTDKLEESAKQGVGWLDQQRHLLQEYNELDRHTIVMTGDLVENSQSEAINNQKAGVSYNDNSRCIY